MQRQHIENNAGRQPSGRRLTGRRAERRGADKHRNDRLFHTVFDDVPLDVSAEDLRAYEKLLHNDLWFDDTAGTPLVSASGTSAIPGGKGTTGAAANRKSQIWIESEAVLAELRRQALEGAESADWEETRKLNLSRHQLAAALEQRSEESVLGEYLRDLSNVARVRVSQAAIAVRPLLDTAKETNVKLFSLLVAFIKVHSRRLLRNLELRRQSAARQRRDGASDDLQVVRTSSFPPPPLTKRRLRLGNYGKMIIVVAAFVLAVTMIFSTPAPQQDFHASAVKTYFSKGTARSLSRNAGIAALSQRVDKSDSRDLDHSEHNGISSDSVRAELTSGGTVSRRAADTSNRKLAPSKNTAPTVQNVNASGPAEAPVSTTLRSNQGAADASSYPTHAAATPSAADESVGESAHVNVSSPKIGITSPLPSAAQPAAVASANVYSASPGTTSAQNASPFRSGPTLPGANLQPAQPALPFVPSRASVKSGMQRVAPLVAKCRTGSSGQLIMKLVISGATGQVMSSKVMDETFSGTPTGICAMHAVKNARFPKFQKATLVIRYPFKI